MSPVCCLITSECTASCHYLDIVSVKMVRITSANVCFCYFLRQENTKTHSTRNTTNFDAHVSHKSPNTVKWKHTTVEPFVFAQFLQVSALVILYQHWTCKHTRLPTTDRMAVRLFSFVYQVSPSVTVLMKCLPASTCLPRTTCVPHSHCLPRLACLPRQACLPASPAFLPACLLHILCKCEAWQSNTNCALQLVKKYCQQNGGLSTC